jgi:hypothetical protein
LKITTVVVSVIVVSAIVVSAIVVTSMALIATTVTAIVLTAVANTAAPVLAVVVTSVGNFISDLNLKWRSRCTVQRQEYHRKPTGLSLVPTRNYPITVTTGVVGGWAADTTLALIALLVAKVHVLGPSKGVQ